MGRKTLLVTPQFGNRIVLGSVLLDAVFESDPMIDVYPCPPDCRFCLDGCPVAAIADGSVCQKHCRAHSGTVTPKGCFLYTCSHCRTICPNAKGFVVD